MGILTEKTELLFVVEVHRVVLLRRIAYSALIVSMNNSELRDRSIDFNCVSEAVGIMVLKGFANVVETKSR